MTFRHDVRAGGWPRVPALIVILAALVAIAPVSAARVRAGSAPTIGTPRIALVAGTQLGSASIPLVVSWPRGAPAGAPLARYELESSRDGGPWIRAALDRPLARSLTVSRTAWGVLRYRVRAVDDAGAASDWSVSAPAWISVAQESDPAVVLSPGWTTGSTWWAFGGRRAVTSQSAASATLRFTGRAVGWVARPGPGAGVAEVSIDGGPPTVVNLHRSHWRPRRLVYVTTFATSGEHTITLKRSDADGSVDVDAFVVLDSPRDGVLVGAGDIARCPTDSAGAMQPELSGAHETAQIVSNVDGIVFTTGDNAYSSGTEAEFAGCYDATWGAFKDRTRPVPGNHEYGTPGAAGYFSYFGTSAGSAGKGWYRYEAGTWRVYGLNSECATTSDCYREQLEWLRADLDAEPHRCVLAYWHRPIFSSGMHGGSTRMAAAFELLYDEGADVVLVGHDHTYERFAKSTPDGSASPTRGIRQFVVGTGGADLYAFDEIHPLSEARQNWTNGVLQLDLKPGSYSWRFLPTDIGAYTDTGTTECH